MRLRQISTVLLAAILLFSLVACSKKKKPAGTTTPPTSSTVPTDTAHTEPSETTVPGEYPQEIMDMDKNYPVDTAYVFPVLPGSDQWDGMTDTQRWDACQVPDELLSQMTTRALIETLLCYPLWPNFYAYPYAAEGYKNVFASCNAMQTLATRANAEYVAHTYFADDLWRLKELLDYGIRYPDNTVYSFPVTPGSAQWTAMSAAEQIAACQIPDEKLAHMSTEALFVTILNYPNMKKLLGEGADEATFEDLVAEFNGLWEFLQRTDRKVGFDRSIYHSQFVAPYAKDYEMQLYKKLSFYIPCE